MKKSNKVDPSFYEDENRSTRLRISVEVVGASVKIVEIPYDWQLWYTITAQLSAIESVYDSETVKQLRKIERLSDYEEK